MRARFDPAPERSFFAGAPLHVVVRAYPETLAVFRDARIDVSTRGGEPLSVLETDTEALLQRLRDATGWRPRRPAAG